MEAWHQKNIPDSDFPFNLIETDVAEFPPHWHEQVEIVYVISETLKMGLNNEILTLYPRDILLIGLGDVHSFIQQPKKSRRIIIQFKLPILESYSSVLIDKQFVTPLLRGESMSGDESGAAAHECLEKLILEIYNEHDQKKEGYKIAIKARLLELLVVLLRKVPLVKYSTKDKNRQLNRLERLEQVFKYVEENFDREITLAEISRIASFSPYHFTRFFKEATGMTFVQYLNNLKICKAVYFLDTTENPITEIAYKSGFNSIKTFNRVFRQLKGCSPSSYQKSSFVQ